MAATPSSNQMSLTNMCDLIRPAIYTRMAEYPSLVVDIQADFNDDRLIIGTYNKDNGQMYRGVLLSRRDIDDNTWVQAATENFNKATRGVLPSPLLSDAEYEEVMACQTAMDELMT